MLPPASPIPRLPGRQLLRSFRRLLGVGSELRLFVLGLAQITGDPVIVDMVYHQFDGLRTIAEANPDGLVQIHVFLVELVVLYDQAQVIGLVLGIGAVEREAERISICRGGTRRYWSHRACGVRPPLHGCGRWTR